MSAVATTKMSSKGQVVIPEQVRKALNLQTGTQFVVLGEGDVVILKAITPPPMDEFDAIIEKARSAASSAGMTPEDVATALRESRSKG